jgi:arylsulfatase A-like enzyme
LKPPEIRLRQNVPPAAQEAARGDLAGYYAHCAALDDCVGQVIDTLEACGIADDTILVFTSDHGDMLGSHAEIRKQRPWDESIRVPFIVHWPKGLAPAGRKLSAPLGTPDIMPTLLGLCGIDVPATVQGEDRSAWLRGRQPDNDRATPISCVTPFGEWTREKGGREYRGLRTVRYTYVRTLAGPWLLYDNQDDPYQQHNLMGQPGHAAIQAQLDAQLMAELKRQNDTFRPGPEYLKQWGYVTDKAGTVRYRP